MKTITRFFLLLCVILSAGINAQINYKGISSNGSLSYVSPVNNYTYIIPLTSTRATIPVSIDYYRNYTEGPRWIRQQVGSDHYDNYYDSLGRRTQGAIPTNFYMDAGVYSAPVQSWVFNSGWQSEAGTTCGFTVKSTILVSNSFGSGTVTVNGTSQASGYTFNPDPGSSVSLSVSSTVTIDGYTWIFQYWELPNGTTNSNASISVSGTTHGTCRAFYKKRIHLDFYSNITGHFTVGSTSPSMPYSTDIYNGDSFSITAPDQSAASNLYSVFYKWSDDVTSASRTLTPSANVSLTAIYKYKPTNGNRNMAWNCGPGDPICFTWYEHNSTGVGSYNIYRDGSLIGTESRGSSIHMFTDNDFVVSKTGFIMSYDVRAVYSGQLPDGTNYTTEADADPISRKVLAVPMLTEDKGALAKADAIPTEYKLGCYPNPFNPATVIQFAMPEAGEVSLKVYNVLSQEVANLIQGNQSAGIHQVSFNASHLPTGIYIARLQAGSKVMTSKLQLIK